MLSGYFFQGVGSHCGVGAFWGLFLMLSRTDTKGKGCWADSILLQQYYLKFQKKKKIPNS